MRQQWYKLIGKLAVPARDAFDWAEWRAKADVAEWIVAKTYIGAIEISTVFLGLDHNYCDDGPPLIFETMAFRGGQGSECWRTSSWEEAEKQHEAAVAIVRAEIIMSAREQSAQTDG